MRWAGTGKRDESPVLWEPEQQGGGRSPESQNLLSGLRALTTLPNR